MQFTGDVGLSVPLIWYLHSVEFILSMISFMGTRSLASRSMSSMKFIISPISASSGRPIMLSVIACTGPDISSIAIIKNVSTGDMYGLEVVCIVTPDKLLIYSVLHLNDKIL